MKYINFIKFITDYIKISGANYETLTYEIPAVYHLLKKDDDGDLNLSGLFLIFVGIALFVSGHL